MNLRRVLLTAATGAVILAGAGCNETANAATSTVTPTNPAAASPGATPDAATPDANGKVGLSKALGDLDFKTLEEYSAHVGDMDECQRTVVFSRVAIRAPMDAITTDASSDAAVEQVKKSVQDYAVAHPDQFPQQFNTWAPTMYADHSDTSNDAALSQWFKDNCGDLITQMDANSKN